MLNGVFLRSLYYELYYPSFLLLWHEHKKQYHCHFNWHCVIVLITNSIIVANVSVIPTATIRMVKDLMLPQPKYLAGWQLTLTPPKTTPPPPPPPDLYTFPLYQCFLGFKRYKKKGKKEKSFKSSEKKNTKSIVIFQKC